MHVSFFYYFLTALAKIGHMEREPFVRQMLSHLDKMMKMKSNHLGLYLFKQEHANALGLMGFRMRGDKHIKLTRPPLDQHQHRLALMQVSIDDDIWLDVEFYLNEDASTILPRKIEVCRAGELRPQGIVGAHLNYPTSGFVETIAEYDGISALNATQLNQISESLRALLSACNWCSPIFVRLIAMCLCTLEHAYALRLPTFAVDSAKKAKKEEA